MKITRLIVIAVGILAFVGIAACSPSELSGNAAPTVMPLPAATSVSVLAPTTTAGSVPVPTATVTAKSGTLRISEPGTNVRDVPTWIALDILRSQGYTIKTTGFARFDLVPTALANGDLDIADTVNQSVWAAIGKGAPIRTIVGQNGDPYLIGATQAISSCKDLQSKGVALASATGLVPVMFDQYLTQNCPGTKPQIIVMPSNRDAALLAGQIDAAQIELGNWVQIDLQASGRFHTLVIFEKEFPNLQVTSFHVRQDFAAKNGELVKDFVRAVLTANRKVKDPQALGDAIVRYLGMDKAFTEKAVKVFVAQNVWDVNGGLTQESVQHTIDFMIKAGSLPAGTKTNDVTDLTYLNAVLGEIGKK